MGKRVMIVFEEGENNPNGVGFTMYVEGITPHRMETIKRMPPEEQINELSTAEYWALQSLQILTGILQDMGVVTGFTRLK